MIGIRLGLHVPGRAAGRGAARGPGQQRLAVDPAVLGVLGPAVGARVGHVPLEQAGPGAVAGHGGVADVQHAVAGRAGPQLGGHVGAEALRGAVEAHEVGAVDGVLVRHGQPVGHHVEVGHRSSGDAVEDRRGGAAVRVDVEQPDAPAAGLAVAPDEVRLPLGVAAPAQRQELLLAVHRRHLTPAAAGERDDVDVAAELRPHRVLLGGGDEAHEGDAVAVGRPGGRVVGDLVARRRVGIPRQAVGRRGDARGRLGAPVPDEDRLWVASPPRPGSSVCAANASRVPSGDHTGADMRPDVGVLPEFGAL